MSWIPRRLAQLGLRLKVYGFRHCFFNNFNNLEFQVLALG
jgi:hypothetical protein